MYKAVLFDFDGVIADTMPKNFKAWKRAFQKWNIKIKPKEYFLLEGLGPVQIAEQLCMKHKLPSKHATSLAFEKDAFILKKSGSLEIYPEIPKILKFLSKKNIELALVTGASKKRVQKTLPAAIRKYFSQITTSNDISRAKPHPQPYTFTAKKMRVSPHQCLVIENAPLGIKSAKSARMTCFAVATTLPKKYLQKADFVFSNHQILLKFLKKKDGKRVILSNAFSVA